MDSIMIDLDGTISNSIPNYNRVLNEKFGYNLKTDGIKKWNYTELGVKPEHVQKLFSMEDTFVSTLPFVFAPGVIQYLSYDCNVDVHIVTDRPKKFYNLTRDWLYAYHIPYFKVVLIPAIEKIEYAKDNNIKVVVDDRPDMPEKYGAVCEHVFLMSRLYNRSSSYVMKNAQLHRVGNFAGMLRCMILSNLLPQECHYDL